MLVLTVIKSLAGLHYRGMDKSRISMKKSRIGFSQIW